MGVVSHASSYNKQTVACCMMRSSLRSLTKIPRISVLLFPQKTIFDAYMAVGFTITSTVTIVTAPRTQTLSLVLIQPKLRLPWTSTLVIVHTPAKVVCTSSVNGRISIPPNTPIKSPILI